MEQLPTTHKGVGVSCTIFVVLGMFAQALRLPALLPDSTSSTHDVTVNVTGQMQPNHRPNTARNRQSSMSIQTSKLTQKGKSDSRHNANLASHVENKSQSHSPNIRHSSESQDVITTQTIKKEIQVQPLQSQEVATLQIMEAKTQRRANYVSDTSTETATEANTTRRFLTNQKGSTTREQQRRANYVSDTSTGTATEANPTRRFLTNQNVSTALEHLSSTQLASTHTSDFQTKSQSPSRQDTSSAQTDTPQTSQTHNTSPMKLDLVLHCVLFKETPTTTLEASDCPPIFQPSEKLQGKIEWELDSLDCHQELYVLNYRVPEDYGFILEFYLVKLQQHDTLVIYSVEHGTEIEKKTMTNYSLDLAPLMLHTNNMKIVVCSQYGLHFRAKFNMSYKAHPRSSIPYFVTDSTTSRYIYNCHGMSNLPDAISCDGVRHCEQGEDEEHCPYRDEGCGDWYPHNDQCIKVILMNKVKFHHSFQTETVHAAEMNCERDNGATLAAFQDSAGQEIMKNMIRKSGGRHAAVGLRRVQPVSLKLSPLYRFLWQWGTRGSPIAYDQYELQRTDALNDCAHLNIEGEKPWFKARPCLAWQDLDSYICMRPNALRYTQSTTLSGLALPGATSTFKVFPTKTCPDGSLVQPFHTCQWGSQEEEEEEDLASAVSPNNFPLFQCRYGQPIHYSLLCDGKSDCIDLSDEMDCRDPRFSALLDSSFVCRKSQELANEKRCDGMQDCFDGSDEEVCESCKEGLMLLCPGLGCLPRVYDGLFSCTRDLPVEFVDYDDRPPSLVIMEGYGLSFLLSFNFSCGEGLYQCQEGFCIPTFLLNNGERDCPKGEDEDIPVYNMTCPGYYRCQGSGTCVDTRFLCDGVHHCPDKDDELFCNLTCPHDSGCVCEGQAYKCSKMINPLDNLHVRYLDLSFASSVSLGKVHFMEYLVFLNLSFCRLANVSVRDMPQLQTLDLSSNLLTRLSSLSLVTLSGVTYLDLSHNPLVNTLTAEFTAMLQVGELKNLKVLNLVNVGFTAIDSNIFSPLSKLKHLDVRANQLRKYSKESLHGLVSLEELYTDETKLCCPYFHPSVSGCHAPEDELSSCSDLLGKGIFKVCLWALSVLALVGNMGVLLYRLLLVRTRTPLSAASILVKTLCASDLLMGVYLVMIGVADAQLSGTYVSREREWRSSVMCTVAGVLSLVSSEVSALLVSLITLDRVLVLCFPFKPELHLTPRSTIFTCAGVWLAGVMLAVVPLLTGMEFYGQTSICIPLPITRQQFSGQHYAFGVFIIFNFVIFLFIGAGQLMIYRAVRKASAASGTASRSRDLTVARRLFMIVLTDFCCWFPVGVMGLLAASAVPIPGEVNVWAAIFVLPLNSALNPFLYTLNALLERSRQQRMERKMKKIVATLQNEISNFNAATVKDVMRICVRSGQVGKVAVDTMFDTTSGARILTNFDINAAEGCHDTKELSHPKHDCDDNVPTQSTQADASGIVDSNE